MSKIIVSEGNDFEVEWAPRGNANTRRTVLRVAGLDGGCTVDGSPVCTEATLPDYVLNSTISGAADAAALQSLHASGDGDLVVLLGYYSKNDGGGGIFCWDADSTETANGGTIMAVSGVTTGRWKRIYGRGTVNALWFGARRDGLVDAQPQLQAAVDSVRATGGGEVYCPAGTYVLLGSQLTFYPGTGIKGDGCYATYIYAQSDVNTDGLVWEWPTQYGIGGTMRDLQLRGVNRTMVRDLVRVINWHSFLMENCIISTAGRHCLYMTDGIFNTAIASVLSYASGTIWIGDRVFTSGTASSIAGNGLSFTLTTGGAAPAASEWVNRSVRFADNTLHIITAHTAAEPSVVTFQTALTADQRTALNNTTAQVVFGSVTTTTRFYGVHASLSVDAPAWDIAGIGTILDGCGAESSGDGDYTQSAIMVREGGTVITGGHCENNAGWDIEVGRDLPATVSVTGMAFISGGYKTHGRSCVHLGPYSRAGAWRDGDVSNGGLAQSLTIELGSYGFNLEGVNVGAKAPEYDSAHGQTIANYSGMIAYLDPYTGDSVIAGVRRLLG